jgi:hypothetical protein
MRTRMLILLIILAIIIALLLLCAQWFVAGYSVAHAAPETPALGWTITRNGEVAVTWLAAPFNPYQSDAYIAIGDYIAPGILNVAAWTPLEVKSARCIASGVACDVTWYGKLDAPECRAYAGVLSLGSRQFEMYGVVAGCDEAVWLPVVVGGSP